MKMFLFGWLLKGRCEVTLADQIIGWAFVFLIAAALAISVLAILALMDKKERT